MSMQSSSTECTMDLIKGTFSLVVMCDHDGFRTSFEVLLCLVCTSIRVAVMQLVLDLLVWTCGGDAHVGHISHGSACSGKHRQPSTSRIADACIIVFFACTILKKRSMHLVI
jgi:hypothetical protein